MALDLGFATVMTIHEPSIETFFQALLTPLPIILFVLFFGFVPFWAGCVSLPWFAVTWISEIAGALIIGTLASRFRSKPRVATISTCVLIGVLNLSMNAACLVLFWDSFD